MRGAVFWGLLLLGVALVFRGEAAHATAKDDEVSTTLQSALLEDFVTLTWTHIKPRNRKHKGPETLLSLDFPGTDNKFVLTLDRHEKKVTLDATTDGVLDSQHWAVDPLSVEEPVKSMVLYLDQRQPGSRARLYVDCETQGSLNMRTTPRQMFEGEVTATRERKHALDILSGVHIGVSLDKLNCPQPEKQEQMQAIEPDGSGRPGERGPQGNELYPNRGDIPILHGCDECDKDLLVKTLNDLINAMKRLREEVEYQVGGCADNSAQLRARQACDYIQRTETRHLREMLEQCELCKAGKFNRRRLGWRPTTYQPEKLKLGWG